VGRVDVCKQLRREEVQQASGTGALLVFSDIFSNKCPL
jgi:hypothetical protein